MKRLIVSVMALLMIGVLPTLACTNLIVTPGASVDGSTLVSYSADSYGMFGHLCHYPAA
ncbi:MAG: C69 family dipeptidase, partial [Bacteroidaceae bacterium]|nr:C69 family dipeptidase [Bacteroidaceae bacterium]